MNKKICTVCNIEKELNEFVNDKHTKCGKTAACKVCRRLMTKKWVKENPEKHKKSQDDNAPYRKEYYQKPEIKLRNRKRHIQKKYNISYEEYEEMAKKQNNRCAICDCEEKDERNEHLAVDHCHKTGKVRALLCSSCNRAIGLFKESIQNLEKAAQYIKKYEH